MHINGAPAYRVQWLPSTVDKVKGLWRRANELGISAQLTKTLYAIEQLLGNNPRLFADPLFHTKAQGGLMCRRTMFSFSVHYIVYETQRIVLIHRIDPLPPHPLVQN